MSDHTHMTRDIKPVGVCPDCDARACDCARYGEWIAKLNGTELGGHYVSPRCPTHRDENGVPR